MESSARRKSRFDAFGPTIIISAANPWDGIPMADQQLAAALARRTSVLYVDPPASFMGRVRRGGVREIARHRPLVIMGPHFARISPEGLPGISRPVVAPVNARLSALQVRTALRRLGAQPIACLEANAMVPVLGQVGEQVKTYWAQDDFVGMAPLVGGSEAAYATANARLARTADLIVAANPLVAQSFTGAVAERLLIPFGCDVGHFESSLNSDPAPDIHLRRPYAVFMGHLGDRIDVSILERLADDGVRILLIGPLHPRTSIDRFSSLLRRREIQWVGSRPFSELPRYLSGADVALVPYTHSRFNRGSFPLKTLEYLAAGLPVVATPLPAIEWIASEDIHVSDAPESISALVQDLLAAGRDPAEDARRAAFAREHSWDARAESVLEAIGRAKALQQDEDTMEKRADPAPLEAAAPRQIPLLE